MVGVDGGGVVTDIVDEALAAIDELSCHDAAPLFNIARRLVDQVRILRAKASIQSIIDMRTEEAEKRRIDAWRADALQRYELREWLRLCDDNPAGHAEFYRWACLTIFGNYRNESLTADGQLARDGGSGRR